MTQNKITLLSMFILFFALFSSNVNAENSKQFGNYVIHYNAFRSDTLTPEIAKAYSLTRRNNRMVLK